jgi:hypothetical protein
MSNAGDEQCQEALGLGRLATDIYIVLRFQVSYQIVLVHLNLLY